MKTILLTPFGIFGDTCAPVGEFSVPRPKTQNPPAPETRTEPKSVRPGHGLLMDVVEDKKSYTLRLDIPGVKKEDVRVSVDNGVLSISGSREEASPEGSSCLKRERFTGPFGREVVVPDDVDLNKIAASFRDGVLTVVLSKREETVAKKIEIES